MWIFETNFVSGSNNYQLSRTTKETVRFSYSCESQAKLPFRIYTEFKVRSVQRQIYNRAKRLSIQVIEWGQAHMALHQTSGRPEKGNTKSRDLLEGLFRNSPARAITSMMVTKDRSRAQNSFLIDHFLLHYSSVHS